MRDRVIETLAYPRFQVRNGVGLSCCTRGGLHSDYDGECRACDYNVECRWLSDNDDFSELTEQPIGKVMEAFDFALDYIAALVGEWGHVSDRCDCEACRWLRDGRRLYDELRTH